jgi:hypothetical protein
VKSPCGYRGVVYVFICYVKFAQASLQGVKAGSKIIEIVWARKTSGGRAGATVIMISTRHKARPI